MAFPTTPLLDIFNRADEGPPPTGWGAWLSTGLKIVSNQGAPADSGDNGGYWTSAVAGPNQEAYITIAVLPAAGGWSAVSVRSNPTSAGFTGDGYWVFHVVSAGTDTIQLQKMVSGTFTTLNTWNQDLATGDKIGIRCVATTIEAWASISGTWTLIGSVNDTDLDGASPRNRLGWYNNGNAVSTVSRYDDFGGGVAAATAHNLPLLGVG